MHTALETWKWGVKRSLGETRGCPDREVAFRQDLHGKGLETGVMWAQGCLSLPGDFVSQIVLHTAGTATSNLSAEHLDPDSVTVLSR